MIKLHIKYQNGLSESYEFSLGVTINPGRLNFQVWETDGTTLLLSVWTKDIKELSIKFL